ncbi:hypothetical protein IE53DRAFT_389415 [Violaceomyces palustris]|uniref:Uncharacterized protein n=1 Tax=Violaceomyces palustris TaxID=1673888 RepID=A0ACD0NRI5_9BASI|nr:hypothetical protein IE53DRAFT_389415 [Violaceomyces palustris]
MACWERFQVDLKEMGWRGRVGWSHGPLMKRSVFDLPSPLSPTPHLFAYSPSRGD